MFSCYPTATGTLSQTLARPLAGKHGTQKKHSASIQQCWQFDARINHVRMDGFIATAAASLQQWQWMDGFTVARVGMDWIGREGEKEKRLVRIGASKCCLPRHPSATVLCHHALGFGSSLMKCSHITLPPQTTPAVCCVFTSHVACPSLPNMLDYPCSPNLTAVLQLLV
jgi:hypothetical protein